MSAGGAGLRGHASALLMPLLLFALLAVTGEYFARQSEQQAAIQQRERMLAVAGAVRAELESELNSAAYLASGVESYIVARHGEIDPAEVESMLAVLFERGRFFRNLGIAPGNRLLHVYPREGNEAAIGLRYEDNPRQWPAVERVMRERKGLLAGPLQLAQGGRGLIYRVPIFLGDRYWGLLSTVLDADGILSITAPLQDASLRFALRGQDGLGPEGAVFAGDPAVFDTEASVMDIRVPGGRWQLAVDTTKAASAPSGLARGVGYALAVLAAALLWLWQRGREQTSRLARMETVIEDGAATLQRTSTLLKSVLAAATDFSIIATDRAGTITLFNRGAERMLGYREADLVGRHTPALLHLPDEVAVRGAELSAELGMPVEGFRVFVEMPERVGSETREWTYRASDGRQVPVMLTVTALRDGSGALAGYLGIAEDITERKRTERALRDQARHTQAMLDNLMDGLITIDPEGRVMSMNPAAERMFGYPVVDVLGRNVKMLMPQSYAQHHDGYLQRYRETRQPRIVGLGGRELEGQRCDGSRFPMELRVAEVEGEEGARFLGVVRDITERRRIEKLKNEFISTVSHELRTPLTAISGTLGLLDGGALGPLGERARQMVAIAIGNARRLGALVNDLLDMERIASGRLQLERSSQAIEPLVAQAVDACRTYGSDRRVSCVIAGSAGDARVYVDGGRLQQVLSNLLSNAIKFSPDDGEVRIVLERRDGRVRVSVSDRGPGIPEAFRAMVFEKFAQADASDTRQRGGSGLGLAIARELIERMDGRIGFETREGEGTTFWIELAVEPADTPVSAG